MLGFLNIKKQKGEKEILQKQAFGVFLLWWRS